MCFTLQNVGRIHALICRCDIGISLLDGLHAGMCTVELLTSIAILTSDMSQTKVDQTVAKKVLLYY